MRNRTWRSVNPYSTMALIQPSLVLTLELMVEHDAVDVRSALAQTLRRAFVGAIDLEVVFALVEHLARIKRTIQRLAVALGPPRVLTRVAPVAVRGSRISRTAPERPGIIVVAIATVIVRSSRVVIKIEIARSGVARIEPFFVARVGIARVKIHGAFHAGG
jgi:hypothetical protein